MRITKVAAELGVSVDTVRHYERRGLIERVARGANGYRIYDAGDLRRLRVVRAGLELGFGLDELARFFKARQAGAPPCQAVRGRAKVLLADLDAQIARLEQRRTAMRRTLDRWDNTLRATPVGSPAGLLEDLACEGLATRRSGTTRTR